MDKGTIVRTVLLVLAWVNAFLSSNGYETIPVVSEDQVALGLAAIISVVSWFKNNYVTAKGKKQLELLQRAGLTKVKK